MQPPRTERRRHAWRILLALTLAAGPGAVYAQLRLPSIGLPLPQRLGPLDGEIVRGTGDRLLAGVDKIDLRELRLSQINALLRQHRDVLEADPRGEPIVRRELLAWSPSPQALAAAAGLGLTVVRKNTLEGLGETIVTLRVPDDADIGKLLARLRELDPQGSYDYNHIYTGSGTVPEAAGGQAAPTAKGAAGVGLIDSGVDTGHAVFRDSAIRRWGCNDEAHPAAHGTAVAALMVGKSARFRGVLPGATLYAADIYCDSASGGAADKIAAALGWLAAERVGVINISLVGPPNVTLERAVGAMVRRGHLLVAAVGNDGPAAPPLYPASYPGVVGVTGVDRQGRTLPEAGRGPQVMFAAPGSQMVTAGIGNPPYRQVRGTSFAAPIVAALLAASLPAPDINGAKQAVAALAKQAVHGEDSGLGIVGQQLRADPSDFR